MDASFIDLDILLVRVRDPRSKVYFLDAVRAYKAGALRAAISSAWIAVVYDLISKYRELSVMDDNAAKAFVDKWDVATNAHDTKKLLELEYLILDDAATKTQVISQLAKTHLNRLREDRHLCAHPAFSSEADLFEPPPELVRLHLVNAIDLVLSQEPLQGKAIIDQYDADVQSAGFPTSHQNICEYVDQRYLSRIRPSNIKNFGVVLAKSLLRGVPPAWKDHRSKVMSSLIAVRERAPLHWPDVSSSIIRLIDSAEPHDRVSAVAFVAEIPDFWNYLDEPTKTAMHETVANADITKLDDFRIIRGVKIPEFRAAALKIIALLDRNQLGDAIAAEALGDLWPRAIEQYAESGSYRGSEMNFQDLIAPFAGKLRKEDIAKLLNAIQENGQNWSAADTPSLLSRLLSNTAKGDFPVRAVRDAFYHSLDRGRGTVDRYEDVFGILAGDGWTIPNAAPAEPDGEAI